MVRTSFHPKVRFLQWLKNKKLENNYEIINICNILPRDNLLPSETFYTWHKLVLHQYSYYEWFQRLHKNKIKRLLSAYYTEKINRKKAKKNSKQILPINISPQNAVLCFQLVQVKTFWSMSIVTATALLNYIAYTENFAKLFLLFSFKSVLLFPSLRRQFSGLKESVYFIHHWLAVKVISHCFWISEMTRYTERVAHRIIWLLGN